MTTTFTVPGPPVPKQRPRRGRNGHWYTPKKTQAYEQAVGMAALVEGVRPLVGPVRVAVVAYMPDKRRRDVDNIAKSVLDGLNGVAFEDDHQVKELTTRRELDRENPRTVVTVASIGESA